MKKLAALGGKITGTLNTPSWPIFDQRDIDYVGEAVKSGIWAFRGPIEKEFEEKWAVYSGAKYGIACTNGTHAIRMALEALGIGPGDEVIVPALTWQATAASVLDVNAIPILVDIDPTTYTIDPKMVEKAITPRTKCIIPVHLYCRLADMDAIMSIAKKYNLYVVEDCSHSHGSKWRGKGVGTIGDIGAFSLQASKLLNTGDGGILSTNCERYRDLLQSLKICGRPSYEGAPSIQSGNFRMTDLQAALGVTQLEKLPEQNDHRLKNMLRLEQALAGLDCIEILRKPEGITYQAAYNYSFKYISEKAHGIERDVFLRALRAELGQSDEKNMFYRTYIPLTDSPLYRPFSKHTHKISDEYCKAIDPARFHTPEANKAYYKEGVNFIHYVLLGPASDMDILSDAIIKVCTHLDELKEVSAAAGLGKEG
ncbi:MAG: DegT/DnrJ/EryC1/StrS family aminotransferase [Eubacteriales bacterium]|nr:DegT/DnrJ/EryC1/StrS family aminotransferase [Eubacteriales bacterium]